MVNVEHNSNKHHYSNTKLISKILGVFLAFLFFFIACQHRKQYGGSSKDMKKLEWQYRSQQHKAAAINAIDNSDVNKNNYGNHVMYTFYEPINDDDERLLDAWKSAWRAVGWEPRVLNLQNAQQHKDYDKYKQPLEINTDGIYNQMHYLRWLAMASIDEGGYMSDYDVFPIPTKIDFLKLVEKGNTLPNDGTLTVFEFTLDGGVPSLISGSASEWNRLAHLIIEKSYDEKIRNDMSALESIKQADPRAFILGGKVLKGHVALKEKILTKEHCELWFGFSAVRFSDYAIEKGKESGRLPPSAGPSSKPDIATEWVREWFNVCGQVNVM